MQPNRHDFQNSRPRYGKSAGGGGAVRAAPSSACRPDFQPPGMGILARLAGDATVQARPPSNWRSGMSDTPPAGRKRSPADQGARLTAEAAKRATETARAATEAVRTYLATSPGVSQRAFAAWAASTEAALKASFGMQNAAIEAGPALSDATAGGGGR